MEVGSLEGLFFPKTSVTEGPLVSTDRIQTRMLTHTHSTIQFIIFVGHK